MHILNRNFFFKFKHFNLSVVYLVCKCTEIEKLYAKGYFVANSFFIGAFYEIMMNLKLSTLTHLWNEQHIFKGVNGIGTWQIVITFTHESFTQFTHISQLYVERNCPFRTFLGIIPAITLHKDSKVDL